MRYFAVYRDLDDSGQPELVDRSAEELSDAEIVALPEPVRAEVLREFGCVLQDGPRGLEVVADPELDGAAEDRRAA